MDNVTRYAAVNAKIKTMESELLSDEDYKNLFGKQSVVEVARYLKEKTAYSRVLESVDVNNIHRGMLENLLKQNMIRNIDKIIHYFTGEYKRFIYTLYAKYEIEELKVIARAVYNKKDLNEYKNSAFIGKYTRIDVNKIYSAKYVRDIISALEGSEFYKYLAPLMDGNVTENLFRFEMVLDMAYYSILQREWSKLSKRDIGILEHAQGVIADLLNLQWIYRGKKFYSFMPEELLNYTINIGYRLNYNFIKNLCYAANLEEFYKLARSTRYSFMFKDDETTDIYMERRMERHIYFELKSMIKKYNLSIIHSFAYVIFLQYEVRDIIAVIETIRYKVPLEQANKYVIRKL